MSEIHPANRLLDLPPELRDLIYEYIVLKPKNTITMLPNFNCFASEVSAAQPALIRVNKQLRSEALPMFYNGNVFLAEVSDTIDLHTAKRWLTSIGEHNIRHLRRLALCGWTKIAFGHMTCRLWIRMLFDLKDGTLEIEGTETEVDKHRHVVKDVKELKLAYERLVEARKGQGFDVESLEILMESFHRLCTSY